jgi:pristinamycin I synthase-3/4
MMDGYPHATQDTAGLAEDDPRLRAELEESLGGVSAGGEQPATAAMARIFANNVRLAADFDPVPFDGDLLFFAATAEKAGGGPVPDEWQPYVTGAVEVHEVHCAHGALTRPESLAVIGPTLGARLSGTE